MKGKVGASSARPLHIKYNYINIILKILSLYEIIKQRGRHMKKTIKILIAFLFLLALLSIGKYTSANTINSISMDMQ